MPSLAKHACSMQGCRNAASAGSPRCDACTKQHATIKAKARDAAIGNSTQRGYGSEHRLLRVMAFERDQWRCLDCGWQPGIVADAVTYGIETPPTDVILDSLRNAYRNGDRHLHGDHIIPIEDRPDLRLSLDNYATRCSDCHNWKTASGRKR